MNMLAEERNVLEAQWLGVTDLKIYLPQYIAKVSILLLLGV